MGQVASDPKESLIENLARDLSEINLIVENARKEYGKEALTFTIMDAWSLAKQKQVQMIGLSKAKIFNVVQKSTIEVPTQDGAMVIDVSKIQESKNTFIGIARPGRVVAFDEPAQQLAVAGDYPIKLFDPALDLDAKAIEALIQYVTLTSRFEKTAKIILKKIFEIQEKYWDSGVSIERFDIGLPMISLDISFKLRSF